MSSDLNCRSRELICWLTADCVTLLICAALVKLSVSARSQNTLRLSICTKQLNRKENSASTGRWDAAEHELHFHQQFLRGERLLQVGRFLVATARPDVTARAHD